VLSVTPLALLGDLPGIHSTHPGVIAHPRFRKLCEIAIMKHLPKLEGWDTLDLDGIDVDSSFAILARKSLQTRRGVFAEESVKEISQESLLCSWDEYRAMGDGQRTVEFKRLRKMVTAVGSSSESSPEICSGSCEMSICSTRQGLNESQEMFYLLSQRTAEKENKSQSSVAAQERFFKSILPEFFVADMLWQLTLHIDGQIVGVQHYFIWRGDLLLFQDAYAPELERLDVARFMLAYAIKRGIGQAFERVRIHSLPADLAVPFVSESAFVSHVRFPPSAIYRVVEKMRNTLNKIK
jgi:hypothetical protein